MTNGKKNTSQPIGTRKNTVWLVLSLLIAILSIIAVAEQSNSFSLGAFGDYIQEANSGYIALAVLSMLGFVIFESLAILTLCNAVGYKRSLKNGWTYSASDIYFSAITPSATGGQPVCAWFMITGGIPGAVSSVILVTNLVFYTLSILIIGLIAFLCAPGLFVSLSLVSKLLILIGYTLLSVLGCFFLLLLFREQIVYVLAKWIVQILAKLKIIRHSAEKIEKLQTSVEQYKTCSNLILKNKKAALTAFVFNFLQRASQIAVAVFAYLSVGGNIGQAFRVWLIQAYSVVGSNCIPIPGAMGVSDYLLLDGLGSMMTEACAVNLELLTRALSFYFMIIICGITVLVKVIKMKHNKKKDKEDAE